MGRVLPLSDQILSTSGKIVQLRAKSGPFPAIVGRFRIRPKLVDFGPKSAELGPNLAEVGPKLLECGQTLGRFSQVEFDRIRPNSVELGPSLLSRVRAKLATWVKFAQLWTHFEFGPSAAKFDPASANFGGHRWDFGNHQLSFQELARPSFRKAT